MRVSINDNSGPPPVTKPLARRDIAKASPRQTIGIDFGTTNTVLAISGGDGGVRFVRFDHRGESLSSVLSALRFWSEVTPDRRVTRREAGPWAIDEYLQRFGSVRFLQSFKTFAASKAFTQTRTFGAAYQYEDIMAAFLRSVLDHAGSRPGGLPRRRRPAGAVRRLPADDTPSRSFDIGKRSKRLEHRPCANRKLSRSALAHYASLELALQGSSADR